MTTTSDKLATGGAVVCWVLAVEGYDYLLTNWTDLPAVNTAWAATDWTQSLGGLEVRTQFEQEIRPLDPQLDFSSATFLVHDGSDDELGKAVASAFKSAGISSPISASVDPSDTTITPLDDTDFPASGTIYLGAENIAYGAKSAGDFTTLTRGKYAPFENDAGTGWARTHRVSETFGVPTFKPIASDWKRVWLGSHVGLWLHVVEDGVLNVKADAKLIFAGVLSDIADEVGATRIVATDFRELIGKTTLLGDQFSGTLEEGVWLDERDAISIKTYALDDQDPVGVFADDIYLGPTQLGAPARLTVQEIVDLINDEIALATLEADDLSASISPDGRVTVTASWTGTFRVAEFRVSATPNIGNLLGIRYMTKRESDSEADTLELGGARFSVNDETNPVITAVGGNYAAYAQPTITFGGTLDLKDPTGEFIDQGNQMPEPLRTDLQTTTGTWGFLRYDKFTFAAKRTSDTQYTVYWDNNVLDMFEQERVGHVEDIIFPAVRLNDEPPRVKQVLYFVDTTEDFLPKLFASTGDATYNEATYDAYPRQLGAAVPWDLLGDAFLESARVMSESGAPEVSLILDEPTTIADILTPELAMRNAHLVFKGGGLRFVKYAGEPVTADHSLSDSDLSAAPSGAAEERPESWWSKDFLVNAVKIEYDRNIAGDYRSVVEVVNSTSQGEYGASPITISARNTLTKGEAAKENLWIYEILENLGSQILATFDEPLQFVRMSVQGSKVFGIAPGDTVSLTSDWIRYALTGIRGVSGVLGVVTRVAYDLEALDGEITMLLTGGELARAAQFSPAALIDSDFNTGGFTAGYDSTNFVIKLEQHQFSLSSEAKDVTNFDAPDKIRIIERSPSTPGSPQSWDVEVVGESDANDTLDLSAALTGFDTTKQYYVLSDTYASADALQKVDSYLADDADDKIDGTDQSKTFRLLQEGTVLIDAGGSSAGPYEFPPTDGQWWTAGNPLSPAIYQALASNANHLVGARTAPEMPWLFKSTDPQNFSSNGAQVPTWIGIFYVPIGHIASRTIRVGVRMESGDGNTVTVRVNSSAVAPPRPAEGSVNTESQRAIQSVDQSTTSTTTTNVAAASLPVVIDRYGGTWISLFGITDGISNLGKFRGFHTFYVEEL